MCVREGVVQHGAAVSVPYVCEMGGRASGDDRFAEVLLCVRPQLSAAALYSSTSALLVLLSLTQTHKYNEDTHPPTQAQGRPKPAHAARCLFLPAPKTAILPLQL